MSNKTFDIVVVGAGIHGAGIAQAAAAHGYSVLILEQNGIAAGTSSRSSKLIHGGLRYLESAQFSLVRECLHERTLLLKLAPELVRLRPFFIPVYPATSRRPWQLRSGLALYATLGGFGPGTQFRAVPRREWDRLDGLTTDGLEKVFQYYDAQTDDAALTRAVITSAQQLGAELMLPATVIGAALDDEGVTVHFRCREQEQSCRCRLLINAGGPWANKVLDLVTPAVDKLDIDLVQGTHIILDSQFNAGIYYVEAPQDRRAVFAIPWYGKLMVGTTESFYGGDPSQVRPLPQEIDYLLKVLGHYFPRYRGLTADAVNRAFAGLRVLPKTQGSAFSRPRDTVFHCDRPQRPRLVTIYGGKLTAYRATAEKFMLRFGPTLPARRVVADTRTLHLSPD